MITLKKLSWSYCFSYGENNSIDLNKDTLTQIIGTNGTGKSSIPLILEEVCFNKNSKGIKKASIPNRYYNKGYWINLIFSKDEDQYEIDVNRKTSIKVRLFKNGQDISSHTATNTYKTIQELIGVDFKTFSQLVYQNTNASLQFLTATDTNRKKFLIDLLRLEEYVKLFEIFKSAAKDLNIETLGYTATITTIEKWLYDNKLSDTNILPMLNLEINMDADQDEADELTIEIANISGKNKSITQNNQYIKMLGQINLTEINSIKAIKKQSYDKLQVDLGSNESIITASNLILKKISDLGSTCPTCEQPVDQIFIDGIIESEEHRVAMATYDVTTLKEKISGIKQNNCDFLRKNKLQKDWEDLYRSIDSRLPKILLDAVELGRRLGSVKSKLQDAKKCLAKTARENEQRTRRNTRIQIILEQTNNFIAELNEAQESLSGKLSILSNLEVLKKTFSTNGLIAYKIENMVKDLEELVNEYLAELSGGKFTLEFVINNDRLNVEITDDGNSVSILELSSGELARVNTATLLAIRKLMGSISKSKINVLFLDEVISVLDEEGKEKLVEVLLKEDVLNTYAVSHGWTHPLLEKIIVQKRNKISYLET